MLCDSVFMIQAFYQALQISAILGNCICEGNSMTVLQLQLDMHTLNMARATLKWLSDAACRARQTTFADTAVPDACRLTRQNVLV